MAPTDYSLIRETLSGHLEAYDELMQRYQRFVYKISYGYTRSSDAALDLTQTVFLKVYRSLGSYRGTSSFKTWLARVACNEGVSWIRANRRHTEGHQSLEELSDPPMAPENQERLLARHQERERLLSCISRLGERYQKALILRYFHEFSVREVAEVLKCSEGTAKNLLFRGVRRLRQQVVESL